MKRTTDKELLDILPLAPGGIANASMQDEFCMGSFCIIQRVYDQSPEANHLDIAPPGGADEHPDQGADASEAYASLGGQDVYGIYFDKGMGYRNDNTTGIAVGDEPETMYMVVDGLHYNDHCCFDYGNAETDNKDDGKTTMEAIYFGSAKGLLNHGGAGPGPWIMADLENGLWGADVVLSYEETIKHTFVTAMIKGDTGPAPGHWAIKGGDAQADGLKVYWDGARPKGNAPMHKQGAIILGIGGDNSDSAVGTFYEGCMTKGYSSDEADDAVQANIVAAGYDKY